MRHEAVRTALAMAVLLISSGCLKLGPDYQRPEPGYEMPESFQHDDPTPAEAPVIEDMWWHVFNAPELDQLVEEVLAGNLDIRQATARVLELRSRLVMTRADRFPKVGLQGQAQRLSQPGIGPMPGYETNQFALSLPASFELDVWGRLARAEEAARADLLQVEDIRHTVAQTMVAEAISRHFRIEWLERRIQITELSIINYQRSLAMVQRRYERGLSTVLALRQARRTLAQAQATLPTMRQDLSLAQQRLAVLLGRYPHSTPARLQPEDYFKRLAPVPPGLPSDLMLRRPDIKAAEASLQSLNAMIGVAKASRFPQFSLTGAFGFTSNELNLLFQPEAQMWNVAMGLAQPLFEAGKRKAAQRAAEARYEQGVADYTKTLLTAFAEVEGALVTRKELLERRDLEADFLEEARATQAVAESRYQRGLLDYLSVLEAQQTRFRAEQNLALVELAILNNRVTLHRALGGGWAEPAQVVSKKARDEDKVPQDRGED